MPFSTDNNYTPDSFNDIMTGVMNGVNTRFGTSYTFDTFVGSGFYKFFYPMVQRLLAEENTFAEAYSKLQDYIRTTNETILIPKTPREGLIKTFSDAGYTVSIEPQTLANAGKLGVCVDVNPAAQTFSATKQEILDLLKERTVAGLYYNGDQRGNSRLSNGQDFEFAFYTPTRKNMYLILTITLSQNTTIIADSSTVATEKLLKNLADLYRLGNNFEPDKYFTISRDAPYASAVELSYSDSGQPNDYHTGVYQADFKELFVFDSSRVQVVFN